MHAHTHTQIYIHTCIKARNPFSLLLLLLLLLLLRIVFSYLGAVCRRGSTRVVPVTSHRSFQKLDVWHQSNPSGTDGFGNLGRVTYSY